MSQRCPATILSIEALPPGLYSMSINEHTGRNGKPEYDVEFMERSLEEISGRLNRFGVVDDVRIEVLNRTPAHATRAVSLPRGTARLFCLVPAASRRDVRRTT